MVMDLHPFHIDSPFLPPLHFASVDSEVPDRDAFYTGTRFVVVLLACDWGAERRFHIDRLCLAS